MEKRYLFLLLGLAVAGAAAATTIYEWKDDQGVLHITDNPDSIPRKYQKKVQERQLDMKPSGGSASGSAGGGAVSPQAPPAAESPAAAPAQLYGGHPPQWWRDQFASLRGQLEAIQAGLAAKQQRLDELHRQRVLYQRSRDRVAANEVQAEIDRDQMRIAELQNAISNLGTEASRAGVPTEWR